MRGVQLDYATIQRWVYKFAPLVYNKRSFSKIKIRQCKYLNNIVEQDHRFIKCRIQNGLGFKSFESARITLSGIEVVHMLRKNQMVNRDNYV